MATPITALDFRDIKNQFKEYLRGQTQFKDYDFEGSNMSVLLDVLAYNTFQNNFYTNMAVNEMFLDSATLENSVVSHAKELNYLPRSATSSVARVRVRFTENTAAAAIVVPRFTQFNAIEGGTNYTFVTYKQYLARRIDDFGNFIITEYDDEGNEIGIEIFEGTVLTGFNKEGFFGSSDEGFKCVLNNENVDTRSIEVFVDDETVEYTYRSDIFGVESNDTVFYVEPYFDRKYAVVFGQNVYGRQPSDREDIKISYRITNGSEANGSTNFTTSFKPGCIVETLSQASGGADRETLESIKFFAPRSVQIQERAVTSRDYETLLRQRFPEIQSISVYGGDELTPPQFGRVVISVNLKDSGVLSNTKKSEFQRYISDKSPLTIEPVFTNPDFLYARVKVNAIYSTKYTDKNLTQIEEGIRNAISTYSNVNLNEFGSILRASKLSSAIDNSDASILSNKLEINPIIDYIPPLNVTVNPSFNFQTALVKPYPFDKDVGFDGFKPSITSSVFMYQGQCAILNDDGNGNIKIVSSSTRSRSVINPNIGTVNYNTGEIRLINFNVSEFNGTAISIYATTVSNDVLSPKSRIFSIRDRDVTVNVTTG